MSTLTRAALLITLRGRNDLSGQVYQQIHAAIIDGRLQANAVLPSTRDLATQLDVSRSTIATAYDRLSANGLIRSRPGAGSFVNATTASSAPTSSTDPPIGTSPLRPRPLWDRVSEPPDMSAVQATYDFRSGIPDAALFPYSTFRALVANQLRLSAVGNGTHIGSAGHRGLRTAIARHIGVSRAVRATPDDITITNGSQQAFDLIGRVLLDPGDVVAVEDPGHLSVRRTFTALGADVIGIPIDAEGLVVDALPRNTRLIYVTPSHQYPLGMTMSLRRRRALLAWAEHSDAAIVEDDYDGEYRYGGPQLEPLRHLDATGRVLYVGSFSKILLPTLRLGFVIAPPPLHAALRKAKHATDWHTSIPLQAATATFIENGMLARHIRRMRSVYSQRHHVVRAGLSEHLDDHLRALPSAAGIHIATELLDPSIDDDALAKRAARAGIAIQPLSMFALDQQPRRGLLIGYGAITEERIGAGLSRLRTCLIALSEQTRQKSDISR